VFPTTGPTAGLIQDDDEKDKASDGAAEAEMTEDDADDDDDDDYEDIEEDAVDAALVRLYTNNYYSGWHTINFISRQNWQTRMCY